MTSVAEDMVQLLQELGVGIARETLFTTADNGAWQSRPLCATMREGASSQEPDVTIDSDHVTVYIEIIGTYAGRGEDSAYALADAVYRATRLIIERTVNGTLYYCIQSTPPEHTSYDAERGTSTYQVVLNVFRYLGGNTNGD